MVAMDGHNGPKAINVQPEFLDWLSDPGAQRRRRAVRFRLLRRQPDDLDDGQPAPDRGHRGHPAVPARGLPARSTTRRRSWWSIRKAQGIIQASWNWPFSRKDFEVYGDHGLAIATGGAGLRVALPKEPDHAVTPDRHAGRRARLDLAPHRRRARRAPAERAVVAREQPDRDRDPRRGARVRADASAGRAEADSNPFAAASRLSAHASAPRLCVPRSLPRGRG